MNAISDHASHGASVGSHSLVANTHTADAHGVCWSAVFAGAAGAAVLSLILLLLGTGIGFSAVSPWQGQGVAATTLGISSIVWLSLIQVLASGLGGYLAGRLRGKWTRVHDDETYFRDTASGFLAWAIATLAMASVLSSAAGSVATGGLKAGAAVAGGAATVAGAGVAGVAGSAASSAGGGSDPLSYFTDSLFRPGAGSGTSAPAGSAASPTPSAEVGRIFATSLKNGSLSAPDSQYLAQVVAQRTGLTPEDAQKRVSDIYAQAQQSLEQAKAQAQAAADTARKAAAGLALWLVASLLIGAFTASWAATLGGRLRDRLEPIAR